MTTTLIVASDLSDRSVLALRAAPLFARRMGSARIIVVHVVDDTAGTPTAEAEAAIEGALLAQQAETEVGPEIETRILLGQPDEALLGFAEQIGAALILVGPPRPRRFLDRLRGTTVDRLIRRARCPVCMVLRPLPRVMPRVVVATDLSERAAGALTTASELGWTEKVALTIASADDLPVVPHHGSTEFVLAQPRGIALSPALERQLRAGFPASRFVGSSVAYMGAQGPAAPVIRRIARHAQADLVVIGTRGRGMAASLLLGSTAAELIANPVSNLLIVPAGAPRPILRSGPVLAALDPSDLDRHRLVMHEALREADRRAAAVVAVAVLEGSSHGTDSITHFRETANRLAQLQAHVAAWLAATDGGPDVPIEVAFGLADEQIVAVAERLGASLILVGDRASGEDAAGTGATARMVRDSTELPVIAVPLG